MTNAKHEVFSTPSEVKSALESLGLTAELVKNVAKAAAAARADSLAVDPCSAPGTLAYIYGVRSVRLELLPKGWRVSRAGNVESTVNDELGIQLCFQNVDRACGARDPEAISGKGSGSRKLILDGHQAELFPKPKTASVKTFGSTPTVWVICVSSDSKNVQAEVSCPEIFEGEQFEGFSKRIFVMDESFGPDPDAGKKRDDDDRADYEVRVTKK
ncbi:MAG: hypothetical protein Q8L91_04420 [Polaromonas sp.]|nr:hypothetical protein [Polaromonas sp.]